jgi:hypothetical protein
VKQCQEQKNLNVMKQPIYKKKNISEQRHLRKGKTETFLCVVFIHNGILCSHEEERNVIIHW